MKGIVLYQTKYGSTRQYAQWIADELGFDLEDLSGFEASRLSEYDAVVLGSSIRAGKIMAEDWINRNEAALLEKKRCFFTVSGTAPTDRALYDLYTRTVSEALQKDAQYFPMHGKMRYKEMDRIDKMTLNMGVMMSRSREDVLSMRKGYDHVKKKAIFGLLKAMRNMMKTV